MTFKTESSRLDHVCVWGCLKLEAIGYCGSWRLKVILWKLEAMKEILMNLDSDGVIDRVAEKSKFLRTVLTA